LPGFYLREVSEPSLTDPSVGVMLCQYFTLFDNNTVLLMEVTYMDGENCVNSTADPLWMQTTRTQITSSSTVLISVPVADDTRSDLLGAYTLPPTDDTAARYLTLETLFLQAQSSITERIVSFESATYVQALNGEIAGGQYECTLNSGDPIEVGVQYEPLTDFSNCSLVNGGFSAGTLSTTYNADTVYTLSGYNGRCAVLYGPLTSPPSPPLESDPLSVGARVFIRLGEPGCTLGGENIALHPWSNILVCLQQKIWPLLLK